MMVESILSLVDVEKVAIVYRRLENDKDNQ